MSWQWKRCRTFKDRFDYFKWLHLVSKISQMWRCWKKNGSISSDLCTCYWPDMGTSPGTLKTKIGSRIYVYVTVTWTVDIHVSASLCSDCHPYIAWPLWSWCLLCSVPNPPLIVQLGVSWIVTIEKPAADWAAHAVNQLSIGSDNGLSPIPRQAII